MAIREIREPDLQELMTANAMLTDAYTGALVALKTHRDKRPVLLPLSDELTHIAKVIDWRIEMEAIVDGILERAGY